MCSAVVVIVEVSLQPQTRTHRVIALNTIYKVSEISRGAQVVYTGVRGILYRTTLLTKPRTLILYGIALT